ncbi:hypothetical protein LTE61_004100, partial [Salmonella enterica subsp. enterica serovar Westminster]|nr:hypothetical protein [Salmonella enterica subsp. enterica serovar Westminster]
IMWTERLRNATEDKIGGDDFYRYVSRRLTAAYDLEVGRERALKRHPGVSRFTLNYLEPKLRAELDRRIMASADLIKLNRTQAVDRTIQRFSGWATSIPPITSISPGLSASSRSGVVATSQHIAKSARQIDFERRRVMVDQTHKLIANIDNIIATDGGAIAAVWHSHWRQPHYDYREPHKDRDLKTYAIRGNWALKKGFMKAGPAGYLDEITQPGEEVFCRCYLTYIYNVRSLPDEMKTEKWRKFTEENMSVGRRTANFEGFRNGG